MIIDFRIIFVRKTRGLGPRGVDHVRRLSTVDRGGAAEIAVAHRRYGSPVVATRGGGGRGGRGSARGALTEDEKAVKRPGDGDKAAATKARGGGELWRERGGKEGGVGCAEMRRGRGAFYRCRGGGR
jgi:hypothetical protein